MSAPLTLYLAESGLNWMKLVVLMEEVWSFYIWFYLPLKLRLARLFLQVRSHTVPKRATDHAHSEVILDFAKEEQKTEEYGKLNPNGRIPTLVDHSNNDEVIWESNAILKYIAERYDTEKKLLVTDENEKADLDTCEFCHR